MLCCDRRADICVLDMLLTGMYGNGWNMTIEEIMERIDKEWKNHSCAECKSFTLNNKRDRYFLDRDGLCLMHNKTYWKEHSCSLFQLKDGNK